MNLSRTMSWTVFPRIYANLHWKGCFQLCCQVWRPIISTIDSYMSFFKIWEIITEISDSWKIQNVRIFYFWKKNKKKTTLKMETFFNFFYLIFKGPPYQYHKVIHFCNILHLEMDFESWVEKGWFPHKLFDKNLV